MLDEFVLRFLYIIIKSTYSITINYQNYYFFKLMNNRIEPQQPTGIILKKQILQDFSSNQNSLVTCRICLEQGTPLHIKNIEEARNVQNSKDKQKYVIKTCNCDGTAGYVHQKCMATWIDTQIKRTKNKHIKCQICLCQVIYDRKRYHELQCKGDVCIYISPCNVVCIIGLLVAVIVASYIYMKSDNMSLSTAIAKILLGIIGFLGFLLIICIFFVLKSAFYKQRYQTSKVYSQEQIELLQIQVNQFSHYEIRSSARTHASQRSHRSQHPQNSRRYHPHSDRSARSRQISINHHPQIQNQV